ncbi:hypothetical protein AGABI2DRAFT_192406 [Agaricus bisporus var. bisporus H97]|uniref:hypothetical protein n=1 Tax=Agaricus bisporus var. bisporus (strain H97 / ATCC MYA-4626 / FGSC 10389) TaxID=936046 RepID=UPI00029F7CA5|nr:hypothetical protein AGABI2DRAFT_192406 [Agaricus bisporus var. bisporus H97]EKV47156.1 hypothetical protein AGABI2DRAFT_192406 [Agaricus bisporus var. bisporus H97]
MYAVHPPPPIPTAGPASHPDGPPREAFPYPISYQPAVAGDNQQLPPPLPQIAQSLLPDRRQSPRPDAIFAPHAHELYSSTKGLHALPPPPPPPPVDGSEPQSGAGANHYPSSQGVPRLPPILQVEKQQVTTSATQLASASRRRNEAHFVCPVPGCGSTFTRRFNLRGHLRSHTEERPYVCDWPGCKKGFARQHDCKRHQALHKAKSQTNICQGCKKTFSRLDALNRHLRSDGGAECRLMSPKYQNQAEGSDQRPGSANPAAKQEQVQPGIGSVSLPSQSR